MREWSERLSGVKELSGRVGWESVRVMFKVGLTVECETGKRVGRESMGNGMKVGKLW